MSKTLLSSFALAATALAIAIPATTISPAQAQTGTDIPTYQSCAETFANQRSTAGRLIVCDRDEIEAIMQDAQRNDNFEYRIIGDGIVCMVDNEFPEENGVIHFVITRSDSGAHSPFLMYGFRDRPRALEQGWATKIGQDLILAVGRRLSADVSLFRRAEKYLKNHGYEGPRPGARSCAARLVS